MVNMIAIVIWTTIIIVVGGGIGFFIFLRTRPKKEVWNAKIYQLGQGIRPPKIDEDGKILSEVKLQDLRPYSTDILEKIHKDPGIVVFRLQKLNKTTPAVENDCVDFWGRNNREVSVLLHKGGCTLLRKGYDKELGEIVFDPLSHSRINLIKGEMAIRKDRLRKEKDILEAISPWIVTGICMLGLVSIAYIMISGFIEVSDNMETASQISSDAMLKLEEMRTGVKVPESKLGQQPKPTPPVVEDTSDVSNMIK